MTAIQVARLKLRCSTQHVDRTRFAIEDGLHTAIPDDRRLVLVRRMQVPGDVGTVHPARRQNAVRTGWLAATSNARHGSDDGAADTNCVWFASREEAETVLLARLLAGRGGEAWYWRLALPDWRGQPLRSWVSGLLAEAVARRQDRRLLAIARCFVTAGAVDQLVMVMHGLPKVPSQAGSTLGAAVDLVLPPQSQQFGFAELAATAVADFAQAMGQDLGGVIAKLALADGESRVVAQAIVRAWLLNRSPALTLSPKLAAATVAAAMEALVAPPPAQPAPTAAATAKSRRHRPISVSRVEQFRRVHDGPPSQRECRPAAPRGDTASEPRKSALELPANSAEFEAAQLVPHRLHSAHAGLWLVVPSLISLGIREWLAASPSLLADGPGAQLLHEIASHHRIAVDDPALIPILPPIDPDIRPEWCWLWRHGLDRWLRRTVGRRLHDLVNRPGDLNFGDHSLVVHYPSADADLALRRRALDRDPGWTDWLGLSIRYNFGGTEDWL